MRCLVCDSTNSWKNIDEVRMKPVGMSMCTSCGFVSYPDKWKTKEEIIKYYRKEYRNPPTANNFYAGQRKLHFHDAFLGTLIKNWSAAGIKPKIFEVGAAYGLALKWFTAASPGAEVHGSEITLSYRRVAYHDFGINLTEDFDDSRKYDLIMSYKVAEHQLDVDKELARYHAALEDNGRLYISVPIWAGPMGNFGASGFDLEYYYDPNHINVWTREQFEYVLKKTGFEIVKEDHAMYDSTYLCKKTTPSAEKFVPTVSPDELLKKMQKIKEAFLHFVDGKPERAIETWPNFPTAWVSVIEMKRKEIAEKGWSWAKKNLLDKFAASCPNAIEPYIVHADFALRFGHFQECIDAAQAALKIKPNAPQLLIQMINAVREAGIACKDPDEAAKHFVKARELANELGAVSAQHAGEALSFNYLYASKIPMPNEA